MELSRMRGKERPRIGELVDAARGHPLDLDNPVSCGLPGHDHPGQGRVVASRMRVTDPPLQWIVDGRCGFATAFDNRSD
jgi:hypothetical protein